MNATKLTLLVLLCVVLCGCTALRVRPQAALDRLTESADWRTVSAATFDGNQMGEAWLIVVDPGLKWSVEDEAGRLAGRTADVKWRGNHVAVRVAADEGSLLEISGDFKTPEADGYHIVALWGHWASMTNNSSLCIYYTGDGQGSGHYVAQTRWHEIPTRLVWGSHVLSAFGDEKDVFHNMKLVLDRDRSVIYYCVDDKCFAVAKLGGRIQPIANAQMDIETPNKGTELDIRYDNLRVRSAGRPLAASESVRESLDHADLVAAFEKKTAELDRAKDQPMPPRELEKKLEAIDGLYQRIAGTLPHPEGFKMPAPYVYVEE